jgi:hypothetical protein
MIRFLFILIVTASFVCAATLLSHGHYLLGSVLSALVVLVIVSRESAR